MTQQKSAKAPGDVTAAQMQRAGERAVKRFVDKKRKEIKQYERAARGTKHARGATKAQPSPNRRKKNRAAAKSRRRNR